MGGKNASRRRRRNYRRQRGRGKRSRLFNGNVKRPGEFIFIWALILAYIVGMWIFLMNLGLNKRDYVQAELVYEGSYRREDRIVLTLSGGEYTTWASLCDLDGIAELNVGETLSVITAKDEVVSVEHHGRVLLALEDCEREDAEGKRDMTVIMGLFAGLWAVYVGFSVWVMCNAHKLPRWIVVGFVRPEYLTGTRGK
ncbi:MAG: hypothetical protein NC299_11415 [Lachnospiraceae bacterium]|nr:hypothetical protein [Ruminococcus sp.]MCM1275954.1 hypothetical protein [Lachnospiraceae bacterium]